MATYFEMESAVQAQLASLTKATSEYNTTAQASAIAARKQQEVTSISPFGRLNANSQPINDNAVHSSNDINQEVALPSPPPSTSHDSQITDYLLPVLVAVTLLFWVLRRLLESKN